MSKKKITITFEADAEKVYLVKPLGEKLVETGPTGNTDVTGTVTSLGQTQGNDHDFDCGI